MESPDNLEDSTKTYMCQACNLNFEDFHEWKLHLSTHPVTKYECNFCFSSYSNKTDFWEHIKTHTNSSTAVKYFCSKYPLEKNGQEESEQTGTEKGVVEDDTGIEPLKTNSVSDLDPMVEHSVMSVEEEEPIMATDVEQLDGGKTDDDDENPDNENFDDESPDDEKTNNNPQSVDAAAKRCKCQFCDKSFPSAFLFKVHLKKHCLPLTYLQVKCLGEPVSLGILVGKSD
ncbi:zinc finger protein 423 [Octopus bimaculoides]|uniref:zinc finger protein 423 n=1 Tax=Octopus bimaculoides TaxID=37653 RepID=UPI00071E18D6|nr:zinc finger protein 423 [Octopus bimaculoides]XP_014771583.1 zinc finger protein 423 [Octopus bimaculoides]XP_014771584.1 zinc finger protein 423 [Octopus bimaculoides]XP_052828941.1 zinc finger protein 423 [Octopus bimaculoides]|eukprot:XP_014771582.1 PREDICTED: zinc finger protein 423-like [Octopus bimaculoides]